MWGKLNRTSRKREEPRWRWRWEEPGRNPQQEPHAGCRPMAELRDGGSMVDTWQMKPGGWPTKEQKMVVETQAQTKSRWDHETQKVLETKAEPRGRAAKVKPRCCGGLKQSLCDWGPRWCRREGGVEGQVADESPEVYGYSRAVGTTGQVGAKGASNQGGADWSTGRGGVTGL